MSIPITILGTVVEFPSSSQSPNWAPALIQFAQLVEQALALNTGNFDVSPQVYTMVSNSNTDVNLPNLAFPNSSVRTALVQYSVFRTTTGPTTTAYQAGDMTVVYNPNNSVNEKWELMHRYEGDGDITFTITDDGQFQFSSTALAGSNHMGFISYSARALSQE